MRKRITIVLDDEKFTSREAVGYLLHIISHFSQKVAKPYDMLLLGDDVGAMRRPTKTEFWKLWRRNNKGVENNV